MKANVVVEIAKGVVWYAIGIPSFLSLFGLFLLAFFTQDPYWWGYLVGATVLAFIGLTFARLSFQEAVRLDADEELTDLRAEEAARSLTTQAPPGTP